MKKYLLVFFLLPTAISGYSQMSSEFEKMEFIIGNWEYEAKNLQPDGSNKEQTYYSKAEYIFGGNNNGFEKEATFSFPLGVGVSPDKSTIYVYEVSPLGTGRLRTVILNN